MCGLIGRIVAMPRGGGSVCYQFDVEDAFPPGASQTEDWEDLGRAIARLYEDDNGVQPEVFLCLQDEFVAACDSYKLRRLLDTARNYIWGLPFYLVLSRDYQLGNDSTPASLNEWLLIARKSVTDLIQCGRRISWQMPVSAVDLKKEADRIRDRHDVLQTLLHRSQGAVWHSRFFPKELAHAPLFSRSETLSSEIAGQRVFIWAANETAQRINFKREVKVLRDNGLLGPHLIATLNAELPPQLRQLCLPDEFHLADFRGAWELRFALEHLNSAPNLTARPSEREKEVPRERVILEWSGRQTKPGLLLTNTFHHENDERRFFAAGEDVGGMLHGVTMNVWRRTCHAVTSRSLRSVLSSGQIERQITVWLHLGHGDGARGLQDYQGDWQSAEEWLSCFGGCGLALAFFSSCRSLEMAQHFVAAGAGAAVGFANQVRPQTCRILSAEVVNAALRSNGQLSAIINAFQLGCLKLGPQDLAAGPMIFYPKD